MCNEELRREVHNMFLDLQKKADEIVDSSSTLNMATERISKAVANRINAESEGYIVDIYTFLVTKLKDEEFFKNPQNMNAFYRLNLREKLSEKYQFDVDVLDAYKKGIDYKETNRLYASACATAGVATLGGILKFMMAGTINIPLMAIVVGTFFVGVVINQFVPQKNKKEYRLAVKRYLTSMENELLDWLTDVEEYFNAQVRDLYK